MNLRKIFYFALAALTIVSVFATIPVFNVHRAPNRVTNFALLNIDSVTFTGDQSMMLVHRKDGSQSDFLVSEVDSTVFSSGDYALPSVELISATFNYTNNRAICQVRVNSNGNCALVERGIVWSTGINPTIKDNKFASGTSVGTFYAMTDVLEINKSYYVRAYATDCVGTVYGPVTRVQPLMGNVTYTLAQSVIDAGERVHNLIKTAMDSACFYYNRYTPFRRNIWVYYSSGIPTAQASYLGSIGFGPNETFMWVGTAMHEMAHYFGSGTTNAWKALMVNGVWQGPVAQALCQQLTGQQLRGDNNSNPIHYWPTGINYRSEVSSEKDLVDHARVVKAMLVDDAKLPTSW